MAYASTVINSATQNVALMTWIDTQMTGNGWTFVEAWTSSTKVCNVYKSPAGSNSVGIDFYVGVYRGSDSAVAGLTFLLAEDWDAVNKKFRKYAPQTGSGITVNATDNTVTDATGVLADSATLNRSASLATRISINTTFIVDVTVNRLIIGSSDSVAGVAYVGVYDTLIGSTLDPVPLVLLTFKGTSAVTNGTDGGASTREPGAPAAAAGNFRTAVLNYKASSYAASSAYAFSVDVTTPLQMFPSLYRGTNLCAPMWFGSCRTVSSQDPQRGLAQNVVTSVSGGAIGDTLTETRLDGSTRAYTMVQTYNSGLSVPVFIRTS